MKIDTKIKGWDFSPEKEKKEKQFSADGSDTLDDLRGEINKLETRLAEIPGLIVKNEKITAKKKQDAAFLRGLKRRKRKKWEKANGKSAIATADQLEAQADELDAVIASLKVEQKRLPDRLDSLKKQVNTLVNAEGKGIEKGIDPESAKTLGEMEVAKQQEALRQQQLMMQKQAVQQKQAEADAKKDPPKTTDQTMWFWVAGIGLLLIIAGFFMVKKLSAKPVTT